MLNSLSEKQFQSDMMQYDSKVIFRYYTQFGTKNKKVSNRSKNKLKGPWVKEKKKVNDRKGIFQNEIQA